MTKANNMSTIDDLPSLVLRKIFKLLPTPGRECAMLVNQRWHEIVNFQVGFRRYIGNGVVFNFPGHKSANWKPLKALKTEGINSCVFGQVNSSDENDVHGFLLPELVQELSFYGKIDSHLFKQIIDPVHWLSSLKLHLAIFLNVKFDKYSLIKRPCLRHLRIFYTHPVLDLSFPFNQTNGDDDLSGKEMIHKNLIAFLIGCSFFRSIQVFEFVGPYFTDKTETLIDAVRLFAIKHAETLRELIVSFPYEWNVQPIKVSLEKANETCNKNRHQNSRKDWGNVELTRLVVACPTTVVPPIIFNVEDRDQVASSWTQKSLNFLWETLLTKQSQLTVLHYLNKYEDWPFPKTIFTRNACTLKAISLYVNSTLHVDCKALECCGNLKKLNLEGNFFYEKRTTMIDSSIEGMAHLRNAHMLPKSLEEICLSKLLIPASELEAVFDQDDKQFPNLRSLQLYEICKGLPHFGLTTTVVELLLDQHKKLAISLWQALNALSFQTAIEKLHKVIDRDVMTLLRVLELCDSADGVHEDLQFSTLNDCHIQLKTRSLHA